MAVMGMYNTTQALGLFSGGSLGAGKRRRLGGPGLLGAGAGVAYNRRKHGSATLQSTKGLSRKMDFERCYRSKRDGASDRAVSNREGTSPRYLARTRRAPSNHVPLREKYMSTANQCYLLLAAHYFSIAAVYVFAAFAVHT
jgi:hypothetical protein